MLVARKMQQPEYSSPVGSVGSFSPNDVSNSVSNARDKVMNKIARKKVRQALKTFSEVCASVREEFGGRGDRKALQAVKERGETVNMDKPILGPVPGVKVGDKFRYFAQLNAIGLHLPNQSGIGYIKQGRKLLATSVVASGVYDDDLQQRDLLIYIGEGGNLNDPKKSPQDQKLKRGNLALANSVTEKNAVRVIRYFFAAPNGIKIYMYDGLYRVVKYWEDKGPTGKTVYKFQMNRISINPQ